jgi:hypothetical protein
MSWIAAALAACGSAGGADPAGDLGAVAWRLEAIELVDGRRLEGLVLSGEGGIPGPAAEDIGFVQVIRPPGRPIHLIGWPPFPADTVRVVERLPEPAHRELAARVAAVREGARRREEAPSVRLERSNEDDPWRYDGPAFRLESTADPTLTREAVVRLELMLEALEALVPPVVEATPFEVRLCGSEAEYRELQEGLGLRIENPACYLPGRRLLVAGSELSALVAQRQTAADLLEAARQTYAALDEAVEQRIRELAADLEARGIPAARRAEIVRLARLRWSREQGAELARIEAARRENDAAVADARRRFDARLAHEAWHAYADARLRQPAAPGLPAWLDEGLAQVVETAPVEAGEIRLDAPDPERLGRLQERLRAGGVPPIADLLTAGQAAFLAGHAGDDRAVAYLAAWGLALDLAVTRPVLSRERIRELTAAGEDDSLMRFETLVGMPVDRFDRQWRERMRGLRPPAAAIGPVP